MWRLYGRDTKPGVQVDSSVAHQVSRRYVVADLLLLRVLLVAVGHYWAAFDGPVTAQTAQLRRRSVIVGISRQTEAVKAVQAYNTAVCDAVDIDAVREFTRDWFADPRYKAAE